MASIVVQKDRCLEQGEGGECGDIEISRETKLENEKCRSKNSKYKQESTIDQWLSQELLHSSRYIP